MRPIDADELMKRVEDTDWYHINMRGELTLGANPYHDTPLYKVVDILSIIETAPTLDLEPVRHGRWTTGRHCYECSMCGNGYLGMPKTHYCPNCGANLEECE